MSNVPFSGAALNERGPVVPLWNASGVFETVALGVMVYGPQIEGRQFAPPGIEVWPVRIRDGRVVDLAPDQKDWSAWQLAWRIELLADRLLGKYPDKFQINYLRCCSLAGAVAAIWCLADHVRMYARSQRVGFKLMVRS